MNTLGEILTLTTFGESHGKAIGGVLCGIPAGAKIDLVRVQEALDRRRPGRSALHSARNEADRLEILSGLLDGVTLGTPIGFIIPNTDSRPSDYDHLARCYRPSHADYTYEAKYGIRDHRGGGRASARETAVRIAAGAIAAEVLDCMGIRVRAYVSRIADVVLPGDYHGYDLDSARQRDTACPDEATSELMARRIAEARAEGDTLGGIVSCVITGVKAGIGDPVFGKLQSRLAAAMMSIPAAKGFDYGMGFAGASMCGSEAIDLFRSDFTTVTNHSGGIQGGISNGADIYFSVAFKPVATLMREIPTVDLDGNPVTIKPRGRHDSCVVPRAAAVVEAMASLVILDSILLNRCSRL